MLKVEKKIQNPKSQNNDESVRFTKTNKKFNKKFVKDQKHKKTINDYADLITKIETNMCTFKKKIIS